MSKITDIINKYTTGEAALEETNAALAELDAGIHLEPGKHELTAEEIAAASCATLVTLYKGFCPQPGYPDPA